MSKLLFALGAAGLLSVVSAWLVAIVVHMSGQLRARYLRRALVPAAPGGAITETQSVTPVRNASRASKQPDPALAPSFASIKELADQEVRFPGLEEVWVFARRPVDLQEAFYSSVLYNIRERWVSYYYLVEDGEFCLQLQKRLVRDLNGDEDFVSKHVFCAEIDPAAFLFAPGRAIWLKEGGVPVRGTTISVMRDDGSVSEPQLMTEAELHLTYRSLRPLIEKAFSRPPLLRLANENDAVNVVQPQKLRRVF